MFKKTLTLALTAAATTVLAGQISTPAKETVKEESIYDRLWSYPTLYKNEDSSFLNELRIVGRFHGDVYNVDSALGHDSDWRVRRLRAGIQAKFFHNLELHVEADFDPQFDNPWYSRLTDAYIAWKFCEAAKITIGKQSTKFTLDGGTSSNELLTLERNNLTNNLWFTNEYMSGVSLSGKVGGFQYTTGYYSGGTETKEYGNFDAGHFGLLSIGYDFAKQLGVKKALLRADYVYNDRNVESTATRPFENVGSLNFQFAQENWGFSTDLAAATGYAGQSDAWGFVVMPWYNITKHLQFVARYTYMESNDPNGLRLGRYENVMTSGKGDKYQEIYAGLNYYIYGHKLKIQTGYTYSMMEDSANDGGKYDGWTWTTGLRLSF